MARTGPVLFLPWGAGWGNVKGGPFIRLGETVIKLIATGF